MLVVAVEQAVVLSDVPLSLVVLADVALSPVALSDVPLSFGAVSPVALSPVTVLTEHSMDYHYNLKSCRGKRGKMWVRAEWGQSDISEAFKETSSKH